MSLLAFVAWVCLALAVLPLMLIVLNLPLLRPLPRARSRRLVSVLIPARDEAGNIGAAIESVLASTHDSLECLVLDDESTDGTAAIVAGYARRDSRVRLLKGARHDTSLWGKPLACAQLATAARGDCLVFMDADVRLEADAIGRIAAALSESKSAMLSGVPRQETVTFAEKLIVPLIRFVLLGFLPLAAMRSSPMAGFGVACGQLLAVERAAYFEAGGHARIAHRIHDGMALARLMRETGHMTDLADFTDIARCRMYRSAGSLLAGFAKNAHEGLGSPLGIVPWSLLLVGGQTAWIALAIPAAAGAIPWLPVLLGALAAWTARARLDFRFGEPVLGTLLHPLGVLALVTIQWYAALRRLSGRPVAWKSRVARADKPGPGDMDSVAR